MNALKEGMAVMGIALFVFSLIFAVKSVHDVNVVYAHAVEESKIPVQYIDMEPMEFTPAALKAAELRAAPRCEQVSYTESTH
jgi:hypothetical protein